ncbi:fasciclin domain-containing protein [Brevibacterium jeotgali]|uniref:Uncaracterized surface protein containing fasciclin (FAS1) repeats n=1 Tax=Brevibacterium jeotgali TaxID=1262550 RepID=A0A2H1L3M0_9MICO|nr:fasciclin domain-containing protein [Brevibacterium jeotgali]TWC01741.1 putative surface protein with fasciclin (FAS1) repeats [Brevibacterium jeotgali]SMY11486.1 Uncaracterized surface protein containing fasciclin (FAS1) repeats [Brevibacterium jeotgali]
MKTSIATRASAAVGIAAIGLLGLSACGGSMDEGSEGAGSEQSQDAGGMDEGGSSEESMDEGMDEGSAGGSTDLVGAGCEAYAEQVPEGDGSVEGMAQDPVATAASNNPMLTTLTSAVSGELNSDVDLVDTLNGDEFTVIAPVDDAFAAVPEEDLSALAEDSDMLTNVLTYHVIPGQLSPDEIVGEHETVQGDTVTVEGEGEDMMFDDAGLVCGGVTTSNATVYMVDSVLMPAM